MMASSLGRLTLTSLGFGKDLTQSADYRCVKIKLKALILDVSSIINVIPRLPPVVHVSEGKLVQVGSGNTSPDTQGTF